MGTVPEGTCRLPESGADRPASRMPPLSAGAGDGDCLRAQAGLGGRPGAGCAGVAALALFGDCEIGEGLLALRIEVVEVESSEVLRDGGLGGREGSSGFGADVLECKVASPDFCDIGLEAVEASAIVAGRETVPLVGNLGGFACSFPCGGSVLSADTRVASALVVSEPCATVSPFAFETQTGRGGFGGGTEAAFERVAAA